MDTRKINPCFLAQEILMAFLVIVRKSNLHTKSEEKSDVDYPKFKLKSYRLSDTKFGLSITFFYSFMDFEQTPSCNFSMDLTTCTMPALCRVAASHCNITVVVLLMTQTIDV